MMGRWRLRGRGKAWLRPVLVDNGLQRGVAWELNGFQGVVAGMILPQAVRCGDRVPSADPDVDNIHLTDSTLTGF